MTFTKREYILGGVGLLLLVILILFLTGIFKKKEGNPYFEQILAEKDKRIEAEQGFRKELMQVSISYTAKVDSITQAIQSNQPKYIINDTRLKNVPVVIRDLTKSELRERAINY